MTSPPDSPFPRVFLYMSLSNGGGKVLPRQDGVLPAYPDWGEVSLGSHAQNAILETQIDGIWVRWVFQPELLSPGSNPQGRVVVEFLSVDTQVYREILPRVGVIDDDEGALWAIAEPWLRHLPEMLVERAL